MGDVTVVMVIWAAEVRWRRLLWRPADRRADASTMPAARDRPIIAPVPAPTRPLERGSGNKEREPDALYE
jgi:hypothetical protein